MCNSISRRCVFIIIVFFFTILMTIHVILPNGQTKRIIVAAIFINFMLQPMCWSLYKILVSKNTDPNTNNNHNETSNQLALSAMNTKECISIDSTPINPQPTMKKRIYYLDNLKSLLTIGVVISHTLLSFKSGGAVEWPYSVALYYNPFQAFAMCLYIIGDQFAMTLFFFIAGYFVPISYKKKGRVQFLWDKSKRIAMPCLVYFLLLDPVINIMSVNGFAGQKQVNYFADPMVTWFLGWLMLFMSFYCMISDNMGYYVQEIPSFGKLLLFSVFIGGMNGIIAAIVWIGKQKFFHMPFSWNSLLFYISYFIFGTIAKQNQWLKQIVSPDYVSFKVTSTLCVIFSIIFTSICIFAYIMDIGGLIAKKNEPTNCQQEKMDLIGSDSGLMSGLAMTVAGIISGVTSAVYIIFVMQFASYYLDFKNRFTVFMSRCAYTVYVIHPVFVVIGTWTFKELLYYINGVELEYCVGNDYPAVFSKTNFGNDALVFLGFIYVSFVSLFTAYTAAWCIKQIPGLKQIL
eukprot:467392_1